MVALFLTACAFGTGPRETVELVISVSPRDSGKVELDGSAVLSDEHRTVDRGVSILLEAQANGGWEFDHWEGNVSRTRSSQTITLISNTSIRAVFTKLGGTRPPSTANSTLGTQTLAPIPAPFVEFRASATLSDQPPLARPDNYSMDEDEVLHVEYERGVLVNDWNVERNLLEATLVDVPRHGTLTLDPDGSFIYTPKKDFSGADFFAYTASAGGLTFGRTTVRITVSAVDDPPVAERDAYAVNEDEVLEVERESGVLVNDWDVERNPLEAMLVGVPRHGAVTLDSDGSFTYTPNKDFSGVDFFRYSASAGGLTSPTSEVSIFVYAVDNPPVVQPDSYGVDEDAVLDVQSGGGVLANDGDVDGNPLEATLIDGPRYGALTLDPDGSFTYVPNAEFSGADFFTYAATAGGLTFGMTTVRITVSAVDDPPMAERDAYAVNEDEVLDVQYELGVLANDSDVDGPPPGGNIDRWSALRHAYARR
ncbi:MAG: Ig-like domain-containing protein [Actinobacteria bacterium]|nr:Ig-like domain-containing protein [Actinomycetota bacterium]